MGFYRGPGGFHYKSSSHSHYTSKQSSAVEWSDLKEMAPLFIVMFLVVAFAVGVFVWAISR